MKSLYKCIPAFNVSLIFNLSEGCSTFHVLQRECNLKFRSNLVKPSETFFR